MKRISPTDTLHLSITERIQLVEDIWDSIVAEVDSIELSEEKKKAIDERLASYHKNPQLGSPWKDVVRRITTGQ